MNSRCVSRYINYLCIPECSSDSEILIFDFVQIMTGFNFVWFHFDGLLVSADEKEDGAEMYAFDDLMLSNPAERIFSDGRVIWYSIYVWILQLHLHRLGLSSLPNAGERFQFVSIDV